MSSYSSDYAYVVVDMYVLDVYVFAHVLISKIAFNYHSQL